MYILVLWCQTRWRDKICLHWLTSQLLSVVFEHNVLFGSKCIFVIKTRWRGLNLSLANCRIWTLDSLAGVLGWPYALFPSGQCQCREIPEGQKRLERVEDHQCCVSRQEHLNKHKTSFTFLLCLALLLFPLSISLFLSWHSAGLLIAGLEYTKYHIYYSYQMPSWLM